MNEVQTPKELLEFIAQYGRKIVAFQVAVVTSEGTRLTSPVSHKVLTDVHVSASDTPEDIARHVCTLAYADITERKTDFGTYRVKVTFSDRTRKIRHFRIGLEADAVPDDVRKPCPECLGSGQYVGFSVRDTCKACSGRKWIRA